MKKQSHKSQSNHSPNSIDYRAQLLANLPVAEKRREIAGVSTAVLEGGDGSPVVLLHGPGESSFWWMQVIPAMIKTHRVIVPDLPGHGASVVMDSNLNNKQVIEWLGELIRATCPSPPILIGHALGGAIAARYAINHAEQLNRMILVDSLGLAKFRPAPMFALRLIRFMLKPNEKTYSRFLRECMYDVDNLRSRMDENWEPFLYYNLDNARSSKKRKALRVLMRKVGVPKIPAAKLKKITIPVSLIWGRHDRANQLNIAERASKQLGWPLYLIENAGDDPKLEQPEAFLDAFNSVLKTGQYDLNNNNNEKNYDRTKKPTRH